MMDEIAADSNSRLVGEPQLYVGDKHWIACSKEELAKEIKALLLTNKRLREEVRELTDRCKGS